MASAYRPSMARRWQKKWQRRRTAAALGRGAGRKPADGGPQEARLVGKARPGAEHAAWLFDN